MPHPKITVAVLTYNAADRIKLCLDAVLNQIRPAEEVIVVDNASADDTVAIVEAAYPEVRVMRFNDNPGCSGGRNRQIRCATNRYVLILDDDAFLKPNCLEVLDEAVTKLPDGVIWSPRICYEQNKNLVQYDGGDIHYIGETVAINAERPLDGSVHTDFGIDISNQLVVDGHERARPLPTEPFVTTVQGGVGYLVDKEAALALGGYDESFFFLRTDGEFSFRMTLSGHKIYTVPKAIVYHRMKKRGLKYLRDTIRSRWMLILINYSWRTMFVLVPAFLVYELLLLGFLTSKGRLPEYFLAYWGVIKNLPSIMRKRHQMQSIKQQLDRNVLSGCAFNMRADVAGSRLVCLAHRVGNRFFSGYWGCVRWLVP